MGKTHCMILFTIAFAFHLFLAATNSKCRRFTKCSIMTVGPASDLCRVLGTSRIAAIWIPSAANLLR